MRLPILAKLILVALLVTALHLLLFGFRQTDDAPYWITVSNYFLYSNNWAQVCRHCVINPIVPFIAALIKTTGLSYTSIYFILNFGSYLTNGLLVFYLTKLLTNNKTISTITAILFYLDFVTQYHTFALMLDPITWLETLILLIYAVRHFTNPGFISIKSAFVWGALSGLAILTKTNLLFFFPLYPLVILLKKDSQRLFLIFISLIAPVIIVFPYYGWAYLVFHRLPWDSLLVDDKAMPRPVLAYFVSFISAYLYLLPFILVGFSRKLVRLPWTYLSTMLICTVIPIIVWPFIIARFTFTTFWFFLPLAANGIYRLSNKKNWLVLGILSVLYILNTNRMAMTLTQQSHLTYLLSIFGK